MMLARRIAQNSLRYVAGQQGRISSQMAFRKFTVTAAIGTSMQPRPLQITRHTPESSNQILIEQRKKRPISPHLEIYKRQITSVLSILHRLTGVPLSAGFYVAGIAYLAAPAFGWHIDSASIAAAFGAWPIALKVLAKFTVALPFTYHCFNGVRHLVWDLGKTITNRNVIRTGWTVVGLSVPSALYLALFV